MQGMEKMPMRRQEINQVTKEHKPRLGAQSQKSCAGTPQKKGDAQMHIAVTIQHHEHHEFTTDTSSTCDNLTYVSTKLHMWNSIRQLITFHGINNVCD